MKLLSGKGVQDNLRSVLLNSGQLMDRILYSLDRRIPCSVVSVGQTEAFVMAQYTLFSEEEILRHAEARRANRGNKKGFNHRGIRFPNVRARNETIQAVRNAHIVGYNTIVKTGRELADKVFRVYRLKPKFVFEANIRRVIMFSQQKKFREMLKGRKILLISSLAKEAKQSLERKWQKELCFDIVDAIPIYEYEEIPNVKKRILHQRDFDLCLLAAGVNAVILSSFIANTCKRVAFDIGWGMKSLITGKVVEDMWLVSRIGLDRIMRM